MIQIKGDRNFNKDILAGRQSTKHHPFHLVKPSPLPFIVALNLLGFIFGVIVYLHQEVYVTVDGFKTMLGFGLSLIFFIFAWWVDVMKESFLGYHNPSVKRGLKFGFALFIISEVMFFVGFFWAYFYNALSPSIWIGGVWPPFAIIPFNPLSLPLGNTGILLTSGLTITYAHMAMNAEASESYEIAKEGISLTIGLALVFIILQFEEFYHAPFSISDGVYGSTFFMITGLHGFHVIIGTIFLFVCLLRYRSSRLEFWHPSYYLVGVNQRGISSEFRPEFPFYSMSADSTGFITATWYWHFVDVVWIYVYIFIYVHSYY